MADPLDEEDSWGGYRRLVLAELRRLSDAVTSVNQKLDMFHQEEIAGMKVEIAMLKVKSGVWGAMGGVLVSVGAAIIALLTGHGSILGH